MQYDQLKQQVILAGFLKEYQEGQLNFPPTYKMKPHEDSYDGKRIPGWTDRIFYHSRKGDTRQLDYTSDTSIKGSDHRPVLSQFTTTFALVG